MGSIILRDVGVAAGKPLFQDLSFALADGDRLGLVAGNGAGKSTLLRCLAGLAEPSAGSITTSRGLRVALVAQDVPASLLDLPLAKALRRALAPDERESKGWRVDVILDRFAAPVELHERPLRQLSGGWQRLALIARAWVAEPDALLLDEPTNHLDLAKIRLLEGWIRDEGASLPMAIASHDRAFLDGCTTRTLFLRPERSRLYAHPYSAARRLLEQDDAAEAARAARDKREIARLRRSASERRNIGVNSGSDLALKVSARLTERADGIEEGLRPAHRERAAAVRLASSGTHAKVLLGMEDVMVRRPDGGALFRIGKLELKRGERLLLLGENGVGKSLLVRLLRQAVLDGGGAGIRVSPSVAMGYLDQQMAHLPAGETPHAFIGGFDVGDQRATSLLAGAGFAPDRQRRPIGELSPGEKARLGLLALRLTEPNLYLLDEPTNHLDIPGQEQLEAEILAHDASAMLVTHDRRFARAVGTRFLAITRGRLVDVAVDDPAWLGDG
jgi:ATPase subunit of ABC transporter with duplicated ATPase domains